MSRDQTSKSFQPEGMQPFRQIVRFKVIDHLTEGEYTPRLDLVEAHRYSGVATGQTVYVIQVERHYDDGEELYAYIPEGGTSSTYDPGDGGIRVVWKALRSVNPATDPAFVLEVGYFDNQHAGAPAVTSWSPINSIIFGLDASHTNIVGYGNWDDSTHAGTVAKPVVKVWTLRVTHANYNDVGNVTTDQITSVVFRDISPLATANGIVSTISIANDGTADYAHKKEATITFAFARPVLESAILNGTNDLGAPEGHKPGLTLTRTNSTGIGSTKDTILAPYGTFVTLVKDGGSLGGPTSKCTATYTIKNRDTGDTLATGQSPAICRGADQPDGAMLAAIAGVIRFKDNNTMVLEIAFEFPDTSPDCDEEGGE